MQIIGIIHCSAGNESVGEMWHETKTFEPTEPIQNVIAWLQKTKNYSLVDNPRSEVILTIGRQE